MRYATAGAFRTALERRLLTTARQENVQLNRLRKMVVFDRLMARLLVVAPDRWMLKGGLALELRFGHRARTTKDMDLSRKDHEAAATVDLLAAQMIDLGDYFTFAVRRTDKLDALIDGTAVRYHASAELAGRPFESVVVDIGFGDPSPAVPDRLQGSDILSFAGIAPLVVPAIPLDHQVAEKVHAYARRYGDRQSTRMKDLIDLVLIQATTRFAAVDLRRTLQATFAVRGSLPVPSALPPPPDDWASPYRVLARDVGLDQNIATGFRLAAAFLDPVLSGVAGDDAVWEPERGDW